MPAMNYYGMTSHSRHELRDYRKSMSYRPLGRLHGRGRYDYREVIGRVEPGAETENRVWKREACPWGSTAVEISCLKSKTELKTREKYRFLLGVSYTVRNSRPRRYDTIPSLPFIIRQSIRS